MTPTPARTLGLTALAMVAFAANSLLCRLALTLTAIDAASFTAIRLVAGALTLLLLTARRPPGATALGGDWASAAALVAYATCFSQAYVALPAATGALLLFGSVQLTMIGHGFRHGERLTRRQAAGLCAACAGLLALLLPGVRAPSRDSAALMAAAGVAWGVYSLRGRAAADPLGSTAGNFWRAALLSLGITPFFAASLSIDGPGVLCAVASGALASGLGYAIWYAALRGLTATAAASVQLSVPVLAGVGAVICLGEPFTLRLVLAAVVILGGVQAVIARKKAPPP